MFGFALSCAEQAKDWNQALNIAGTLRSRRTADTLRELDRYAAAHQHLDEVVHLRHRIKALVCTDNP